MKKEIEQRVNEGISHIKPFPHLVQEAMNLIDSDDSDNHVLANIIGQDPILTTRILSLANSSFYGMSRKVEDIETANAILGNNVIRNILVSAGALECFPVTEQRKQIWIHSIEVASVSELLADKFNQPKETAYMAGLLHDVGKFLLLDLFPEYKAVIDIEQTNEFELSLEEEIKIMGLNHALVGAKIIKVWNLPQWLEKVIVMHDEPAESDDYAACCLLYLADEICHKLESGMSDDDLLKSLNFENAALINISVQDLKEVLPEIKDKISSLDGLLEQLK